MPERLHAFHMPLGTPGATFTERQEKERRNALRAEIRALMPVVDRLPDSIMVDRIGVKDGALTLFFDLEARAQGNLPIGPAAERTPMARLYHDLSTLRESVMDQQRAIYSDTGALIDDDGITRTTPGGKRIDLRRYALMREYQGTTLTLPFSTGPMVVEFPSYPLYKCDKEVRTISARVLNVSPFDVRLVGIRYVGTSEPAATSLKPRSPRYALLPPAGQREDIGLRCWAAAVHSARVTLRVRTALDMLTDRIRHYEIVEQLETDAVDGWLLKSLRRLCDDRH